MFCPRCQADNRAGALFCGECGAPIEIVCPACGASVAATNKFCDRCGASLRAGAARDAVPARFASPERYTPAHLADRKQVTVLLGDLKSSLASVCSMSGGETWPGLHDPRAGPHAVPGE